MYQLCSRTFVIRLYTSLQISILLADEWFASRGMASLFLVSKFFRRWIIITVPLPCGEWWWCHWLLFWCFSSQLSQCFCLQLLLFSLADLFDVCCSVHQYYLYFSRHSKLLYWLCPMFVQCSVFSQLQNDLLFSHRQLSDLSFLDKKCSWEAWRSQRNQCKRKAKIFYDCCILVFVCSLASIVILISLR